MYRCKLSHYYRLDLDFVLLFPCADCVSQQKIKNKLRCWPHFDKLITGTPAPKATWTKDGKPVKKLIEGGPEISQTPEFAKIKLKAAKRNDAGEYAVELENNVGKAKVPVIVKVIGKLDT